MAAKMATSSRTKTIVPGLLDKLVRRSLVSKIYPESEQYRSKLSSMLEKPETVYAGFDATADSLHVGNLVAIMNLMHFQRHGHRVICVIGDATARIGDPSGHHKDREKLNLDVISHNASKVEAILRNLFNNHKEYFSPKSLKSDMQEPIIVKNSSWYQGEEVVEFVSNFFREVRLGDLLHKKSISERLESQNGLNMSEFCYQIFQAYDWIHLRKKYRCRLQVGGSDQAGNIYTGHDFIKRISKEVDSIGLLSPLITDSRTGKKLGKSSTDPNRGVWLSKDKTSPYELFQFFHRTPDSDVSRLLNIYSLYDCDTIQDLIYTHLKKAEDVWFCQRKLAKHACLLVHGKDSLDSAERITHAFYNKSPEEIAMLSHEELSQLFDEKSIFCMVHRDGLRVLDLVKRADCFKNDLDAERLIRGGGLRINGHKVTSFNVPITSDLILGNGVSLMKIGKKIHFLFKWISESS